jgi:hypothetical protein
MKQTAVEWLVSNIDWMLVRNSKHHYKMIIEQAKEMEEEQQGYSEEDMINFVQFATQYYANDWMENRSIYELLEQFKNK